MTCGGCGNGEAFRTRTYANGDEYCDRCGSVQTPWVPDVFWDGRPEINLADGPDGKPRVFGSKGEKALYLRERGISEAGDSHHGAPWKPTGPAPVNGREEVRKALAEVRKMSPDYRRQKYLQMLKGGAHG